MYCGDVNKTELPEDKVQWCKMWLWYEVFLCFVTEMSDQQHADMCSDLSSQLTNKFSKNYHWRWNTVLSIWSPKQTTKFARETPDIPMIQESSHIKLTNKDNAHHCLQYQGYWSLWIHPTRPNSQPKSLKWLWEAVHRERPELWPNNWILHNDNASAHKALSLKQFLAQKSITEMEHPLYSLGSEWLLAVSKNKVYLKGTKISEYWTHSKNVMMATKAIPWQEFQKYFHQCQHHWAKCIAGQGEYYEGDHTQ